MMNGSEKGKRNWIKNVRDRQTDLECRKIKIKDFPIVHNGHFFSFSTVVETITRPSKKGKCLIKTRNYKHAVKIINIHTSMARK